MLPPARRVLPFGLHPYTARGAARAGWRRCSIAGLPGLAERSAVARLVCLCSPPPPPGSCASSWRRTGGGWWRLSTPPLATWCATLGLGAAATAALLLWLTLGAAAAVAGCPRVPRAACPVSPRWAGEPQANTPWHHAAILRTLGWLTLLTTAAPASPVPLPQGTAAVNLLTDRDKLLTAVGVGGRGARPRLCLAEQTNRVSDRARDSRAWRGAEQAQERAAQGARSRCPRPAWLQLARAPRARPRRLTAGSARPSWCVSVSGCARLQLSSSGCQAPAGTEVHVLCSSCSQAAAATAPYALHACPLRVPPLQVRETSRKPLVGRGAAPVEKTVEQARLLACCPFFILVFLLRR